jgi:hypothetical protein
VTARDLAAEETAAPGQAADLNPWKALRLAIDGLERICMGTADSSSIAEKALFAAIGHLGISEVRDYAALAARPPQPAPELAAAMAETRQVQAELENQVARGDRLEGKNEDIAADLDRLRERVARTAAKLDADALVTAPSKKSEIQAETAARLRETLGDQA